MFGIFDEVYFLNTGTWKVDKGKVMKVTVVPSGISKDAEGKDVLEGVVELYELESRMVLSGSEAFASREEVLEACRKAAAEE